MRNEPFFKTVLLSSLLTMTMETAHALSTKQNFIGFDLGTSGARISIIEARSVESKQQPSYKEIHTDAISWSDETPYDSPSAWTRAIESLLLRSPSDLRQHTRSICVSGTSASAVLVDRKDGGKATRKSRMYDYDIVNNDNDDPIYALRAMEALEKYAPATHTVKARTSTLSKLLKWNEEKPLRDTDEILAHQSDYVAMHLLFGGTRKEPCGSNARRRTITTDWHNCLKLGYDVENLTWPTWLRDCLAAKNIDTDKVLPDKVLSPGSPMGTLHPTLAEQFGFGSEHDVDIVGGTTDSNAAFFAAIASTAPQFGTSVTSLGSTTALKQYSKTFVQDASLGVYSHRFPDFSDSSAESKHEGEASWLIGGASNVGCQVLRQEQFSNEELDQLSEQIDCTEESSLAYYPLTKKGERFPTSDGEKEPVLTPVPETRKEYLHAILQGISDVERDGYRALAELGAEPSQPTVVWTCGGGARNDMWLKMRERRMSLLCINDADGTIPVRRADNTEASFGAAILAAGSFVK